MAAKADPIPWCSSADGGGCGGIGSPHRNPAAAAARRSIWAGPPPMLTAMPARPPIVRPASELSPLSGGLALLVVGVAVNWTQLAAFPGILPAFTAKEYCSCRFVMGQTDAYCCGYVEQWLPDLGDPGRRSGAAGDGARDRRHPLRPLALAARGLSARLKGVLG